MKQKLRIVYFNVSLVCGLLVGIELLGQLFYYVVRGHPLFQSRGIVQRHVFELHPFLVGRLRNNIQVEAEDKTITSRDTHTRWTGKTYDDKNSVKIAVLGGSTTFGVGVTDSDSWPWLLQSTLGDQYSVMNYGIPGYSTAENIIQMALIVPESKPKFIILYEGWNDIRNYHDPELGPDYFSHGIKQYDNLGITQPRNEPLFSRLSEVSAICRLATILARKLPRKTQIQPVNQPTRTSDPFVDRVYLRNLKTLKTLGESMGAYVLFVPQVLNCAELEGKKSSNEWSPGIEDDALCDLLKRFNQIMDEACQPTDSRCAVLREVTKEHWERDDFVDDGHFSRKGGGKMAALVAAGLRELNQSSNVPTGP